MLLGQDNLNAAPDNLGDLVRVKNIYTHPQYEEGFVLDYDYALLELNQKVMRPRISLLNEANAELAAPGQSATIVGWGSTAGYSPDDDEDTPYEGTAQLQSAELPLVSNEDCNEVYAGLIDDPGQEVVNDRMICAGIPEGGIDTCQGDSGGPLIVNDAAGNAHQTGIVSFGAGCAAPGIPGVYARIPSPASDWITSTAVENGGLETSGSFTVSLSEQAYVLNFGNFK